MLKKIISIIYNQKGMTVIIALLFSLILFLTWVDPVFAFELTPPPQEYGLPALIVWLIHLALIISSFIMVGILIAGGFQHFFSAGQPKEMAIARNKIFKSLMGIGLLLSAFLILHLINPELVDRERLFLDPIEPVSTFEFFLVPEIPGVEAEMNKTFYIEPKTSSTFSFNLGWLVEENLLRNLLDPPVFCKRSADIPDGVETVGEEWTGPLEPLRDGRQRITVRVYNPLDPVKGTPIIEEPLVFHLRCQNRDGIGITKTVNIEVRVKTIYYRIPVGKIVEWAVFDRNARTRFDKIESFLPEAIEQSYALIEANRYLIEEIIEPANICGITTLCLVPPVADCIPSPPREIIWPYQGRYDRCGGDTIGTALYHVPLMTPWCQVQRASPLKVLNQSLEIERILLSPDKPCTTFKCFMKRRDWFFNKPLPIDLPAPEGPKSIIYPPTYGVAGHSGAFDHWRVGPGDDKKWTNFLVVKRQIETSRDELRRYLNSLQLAAYLITAGCKNHPEFPITHHQLLPDMVRDPFRYRKPPYEVKQGKEVRDIIGEMRGIRIDDLINWEMENTHHVYIKSYIYKKDVNGVTKQILRLKKIKNIEPIKNERRMAVKRIRMKDARRGEIFIIFEYDPFTFYCPEFYQDPRIIDLKKDINRITNIRFGPRSNPSSTTKSNLMSNNNNQNGLVILENEKIKENPMAILTSAPTPVVGEPKVGRLLYRGDIRMHEIPSGQAIEEAMDLLTKMDGYLTRIVEAMKRQEEIAVDLMRYAYDDFTPMRCIPVCRPIRDDYNNLIACIPESCRGFPYNMDLFDGLLREMRVMHRRIVDAQKGIESLLHEKEKWETIWFFPQEVTMIRRIEALTEHTRMLLSLCPVRPRGMLYAEYGGKPTGRPMSCVTIRAKILAGEAVEGVYAVTCGIGDIDIDGDGIPDGRNCFEECRPPNRETSGCLECLREVDILCRAACIDNLLGAQCLACIPCRSLKNYFCFFLEERFYPK